MKRGGTSGVAGRKPRKLVEITGLETLQQTDEKLRGGGTSRKLKHFNRKKKVWTDDGSISSTVQLADICLSTLPVVGDYMTDDELRRELIIRNPAVDDALSGTRQWLLDQLGRGTISIVKSREAVSEEFLSRFDRVNSSMTVEQLRREFIYRHPSKKKIARGKWKAWLLLQLHEGSICAFQEESKMTKDGKIRPDSPQESMANTVSTAPTIFSSSTQSTFNSSADQEQSVNIRDEGTKRPQDHNNSEEISLSKNYYYKISPAGRKPIRDSGISKAAQEEPTALATKCEKMPQNGTRTTRQARLQMGNRYKYFNASQVARKNASVEELTALKASVTAPKKASVASDEKVSVDKPEEDNNKPSEFASKKWLNDAKRARKLSRRSICIKSKY